MSEEICKQTGKIKYKSRTEAGSHRHALVERKKRSTTTYKCTHCGSYHVTSKQK